MLHPLHEFDLRPPGEFGPDAVSLMGRTCDEAWEQLLSTIYIPLPDVPDVRNGMAMRVIAAVSAGERDPARLRAIALDAVDA
jgi:hypothetical protein